MTFNYNDFLSAGKTAEDKIAQMLLKMTSSTKEEDFKGVDLKLTFTFDVKMAKKIRRTDMAPSYDKTWIEYKNVKGNLGSICKPDLDFFIIEGLEFWYVKNRQDTYNFFVEMSKFNGGYKPLLTIEKETKIELYQPYQRLHRKDVIMLVEIKHPSWPTLLKIPKER